MKAETMDQEEKEWLKPKDVAKRIGISLSEVYALRSMRL